MRKILFILLLFSYCLVNAQEYVYVNTNNLILRDRPEQRYMVFAILHAPCRLKIESADHGYNNDKAVQNKFYQVSIAYDKNGIHNYMAGWVMKKYVVRTQSQITMPHADIDIDLLFDKVDVSDHYYTYSGNVKRFNAADFVAPTYKGGEPQTKNNTVKRAYQKGPRGGCYYLSNKQTKVYVDSKYCKGVK